MGSVISGPLTDERALFWASSSKVSSTLYYLNKLDVIPANLNIISGIVARDSFPDSSVSVFWINLPSWPLFLVSLWLWRVSSLFFWFVSRCFGQSSLLFLDYRTFWEAAFWIFLICLGLADYVARGGVSTGFLTAAYLGLWYCYCTDGSSSSNTIMSLWPFF